MPVAPATTPFRSLPRGPTVGILSTYPPTPCGLATFSAALASSRSAPRTATASSEAPALCFLIDFDEPFGYSVVEAMACGTPVIAFDRRSALASNHDVDEAARAVSAGAV